MSRYVLLMVAVLGLCSLAAADFWPAGKPGAEELEAQPIEASIMAKSRSKDRSQHRYELMGRSVGVKPSGISTNFLNSAVQHQHPAAGICCMIVHTATVALYRSIRTYE